MREQGYNVDKLTPTHSKNDIVWDSENNQFVLVYEDGTTYTGTTTDATSDKSKMWKVYTEIPTESEYSIYYSGTTSVETVNANGVGFDAGNASVKTINYTNTTGTSKNNIIRTTSANTTLNIDAEADTITHYGAVGNLVVTAVDYNCYYEYGSAAFVKVAKGSIVVKNGGSVDLLYATSSNVVAKVDDGGTIADAVCVSTNDSTEFSNNKGGNITFKTSINGTVLTEETINDLGKISTSAQTGEKPADTNYVAILNKVGYESLQTAIDKASDNDVIYMVDDVYLESCKSTDCINITKPLTIKGNNHTITGKLSNKNDRIVNIGNSSGIENGKISISDLIITSGSTSSSECRGINAYYLYSCSIELNNVDVSIPDYYAFNIVECDGLEISMNDCSIQGWATIQNWSNNVKLVANDCSFDAVNIHDGGNDSFSNIVLSQRNGENNDFTFNNCNFTADKSNPNADVTQVICELRSSCNNKVSFNNCSFEKCAAPTYITSAPSTDDDSNTILINGKDVSSDKTIVGEFID